MSLNFKFSDVRDIRVSVLPSEVVVVFVLPDRDIYYGYDSVSEALSVISDYLNSHELSTAEV